MKKIASLSKLQKENPNGLLPIGTPVLYAEYGAKCYFSGLLALNTPSNNGHEIYRSKSVKHEDEDFYQYPASSKNSLNTLFTVQTESGGDLLVVFVADISKDGHVQATLILTDAAWQEILASSQRVMRVEQFFLHILEEQLQVPA
jgi:hypothetical protein